MQEGVPGFGSPDTARFDISNFGSIPDKLDTERADQQPIGGRTIPPYIGVQYQCVLYKTMGVAK